MALPAETRRRRFGIEEYFRMGEAGILGEDERVELVDGELVEMAARDPSGRHIACVNRLTEMLAEFSRRRYVVSVQNTLVLGDDGAPLPDLALLRRREGCSGDEGPPRAEEALLVVEVADTSLRFDREVKLPRYAAAGVPEAWIVDLVGRGIEVYASPGDGGGYGVAARYGAGEAVRSETVEGLVVDAGEVLGR
jgi:Uma2 family endonuclease